MAADQRRKRMSGANTIGFSSREHYRAKKKKMASPDNNLTARDHISLEWDGNQKKVVAKREQVGLGFRDLHPFVDSVPHRRNSLADVCMVPQEIFELESLSEVLSCEVWQTNLSEGERNFLQQFLPRGVDAEQVVQALLNGENFHFGNPFLDWGAAVCFGNLHPDEILSRQERLKADKRRYYAELQKYHYDIIDNLQKLKAKWESCKDPEKDILQKMWGKSRGETAHVNDSRQGLEHDLTAASDSCSWNADEKPCSSDNKNSSVVKTGDVEKRSKDFAKTVEKEKPENTLIASDNVLNVGAKARKKEKLPKHSIQQTDGAKYMSYLKISKKQHQIVTSMKKSGKSIQSRALNRILGNINKLDVQPYGVFVEEEQKKLNAHWLRLVKGLPAAYAIWKELRLQKQEITKSLERELKEKLNPWLEDEQKLDPADDLLEKDDVHLSSSNDDTVKETDESLVPDQNDGVALDQERDMEDSGDSGHVSARNQSPSQNSSSYGGHELELNDVEQARALGCCSLLASSSLQVSSPNGGNDVELDHIEEQPYSFSSSPQNKHSLSSSHDTEPKDVEEDEEYSGSLLHDQSFRQVSSASGDQALKLNDMDSMGDHSGSELVNASSVIPKQSVNESIPCIASSCRDSRFSSGGEVWPTVGLGQSYIEPTPGHQAYTTSGGLALMHPQGEEEQKTCFLDLESNMHKESDGKNMLQRQSDDSPFGSFPNHDQSELLQSLFKGQGMPSHNPEQLHSLLKGPSIVSHNQEHKQMVGINLQEPGNVLIDSGQFSGHFQNQMPPPPHALAQDQRRQNDVYGHGSIPENIYCDGGGYLMQRSEHLHRQGRLPDWNASSAQMGVPIQPQLNSGQLLSQNWLSGEHQHQHQHQQQPRSMWTNSNGVGHPSQGIQTGANRDQSLLNRGGGNHAEQISNSDQSLFSVLSQCNQMHSSRTRFEPAGTSEQFVAPRNYRMMMGRIGSSLPPEAANPLDYLSGGNAPTSLMPEDVGWMNHQSHQNSALHDPLGKLYPRSWNQ